MIINRREFFKKTALGTTALATAPSFNNLLGASTQSAPVNSAGFPHRFVFICKSNGNSYSGCLGSYKAGRHVLSNIKWATVDFELAKQLRIRSASSASVEITTTQLQAAWLQTCRRYRTACRRALPGIPHRAMR